jgi:ribonuclease BN (tRNA processing enzyme)
MELTFFGTGAAFAGDAFNSSYLLDRRVVIDAGAPLHVLMRRTGHNIADLEAAVITHQHADHTFGLPHLMATRAIEAPEAPPFTIAGPPGFERYISDLFQLAWGDRLHEIVWNALRPKFIDLWPGDTAEVAGFQVHAEEMHHVSDIPCLGFGFERDGVRLAYSGDTGVCPGRDTLIGAADHILLEMTGVENDASHMSRASVEALVGANPDKSFYLTHLNRRWDDRPVPGALFAADLETVELTARGS